MNSLKAMYGCGLNFFIKLAYNSLFLYKFAKYKLQTKFHSYEMVFLYLRDIAAEQYTKRFSPAH